MKRLITRTRVGALLLAAVILAAVCLPAAAAGKQTAGYTLPDGTDIYSESALLINLGGGAAGDVMLYGKNADEVHAPGAMMRFAVVAYALKRIQEKNLDPDTVTGTYTLDMFNNYVAGTGVPTANMNYGEVWTLRDLIAVSFMQNACDAVTTLAITLDGSVQAFVEGMNAMAEEIGCEFTHFGNITGVDSLSEYTTANDMARIIRYARTFSLFESLVANRQIKVKPVAKGDERTIVAVNNMMQSSSTFYYSPLVYGRTGMSEHEGRTYAAVARDSGYEYLCVVMGAPEKNANGATGLHFLDALTLFRWAFNHFSYRTVLGKSEILASVKVNLSWSHDHVNLVPREEFATVTDNKLQTDQIIKKITLNADAVDAPVEAGDVLGKVELIINVDQKLGEVELVAAESIRRNWLLYGWSAFTSFFSSGWFILAVVLLLLLLGGYIAINVLYNRRRKKNNWKRVNTPRN